jgi:hypothetical protein
LETDVESAVDQALSKRFVKKQQMSWSRRGAHLLLQVRTRALNEELREKFDEWYPVSLYRLMPGHIL